MKAHLKTDVVLFLRNIGKTVKIFFSLRGSQIEQINSKTYVFYQRCGLSSQ